jgi:hypothetical protein
MDSFLRFFAQSRRLKIDQVLVRKGGSVNRRKADPSRRRNRGIRDDNGAQMDSLRLQRKMPGFPTHIVGT